MDMNDQEWEKYIATAKREQKEREENYYKHADLRPPSDLTIQWHRRLNEYNNVGGHFRHWMYMAKRVADEVPRLMRLFEMQRTNALPEIHQQCSHQEPEEIKDNYLTCCLGKRCDTCPHLLALEHDDMTGEQQDIAKAWTCATHILVETEGGQYNKADTSEGFILTVGDRMYWDNVYHSLSQTLE